MKDKGISKKNNNKERAKLMETYPDLTDIKNKEKKKWRPRNAQEQVVTNGYYFWKSNSR